MNSNNFKNHGCSGCGGSRHGSSGCFRVDTGQINCNAGPFTAIDAACIIPPANNNASTILAFSSGTIPAVLTTVAGLVGTSSQIGFGTSIANVTILGNSTIDLTLLPNEAFTVPRAGNLTAVSATFTATETVTLGVNATIHAQVYRAPVGVSIFSPIGAIVDLAPPLASPIAIGALTFGSVTFPPVPLAVGDRLVMVFTVTAPGLIGTSIVTGTASAGITIS